MTCNMRDKHPAMFFFKIITTTSIEAGKLKLPNGFTREHGGDVSNPVFLKPPDDKERKIHWNKHEDGNLGGSLECLKRMELTSKITKAANKARTITSRNPLSKNISSLYLLTCHEIQLVPPEFARIHLKNKQRDMILYVIDGRTWHVKYLLRRGTISAGWKKFASDNNLKVGDVCVFELTKNNLFLSKYQSFHLGENHINLIPLHHKSPIIIIDAENETTYYYSERLNLKQQYCRKATQKRANEFTPENPYFTVKIKPNNWRDYRQVRFIKQQIKEVLKEENEKGSSLMSHTINIVTFNSVSI
ncbi:B3 domain-containing protein REM8-like [Lotus japonicus]|uniref:B3 domain-containing protein REM8-like n=1 Tax=Lotus japonicus TaxID=34305 RepID=UPI0025834934|nr:B3 domain-containing protein REM8-like [Lotus japonicus]